jgi:hypothetical protein
MKKISALLVAIIGVVCIVFGVLFIMQAGTSRDALSAELKESGVTLATLNTKYDEAKAGLAKAIAAGAPGVETSQSVGWQKASLGSAKTSASTISFVEKTGMVVIIVGVGFALAGLGLLKKD